MEDASVDAVAFSQRLGRVLPYDTIEAVRARLAQLNPVFARLDILPRFGASDTTGPAGDAGALGGAGFVPAVANYYQTDPISRASRTMAECTEVARAPAAVAAE